MKRKLRKDNFLRIIIFLTLSFSFPACQEKDKLFELIPANQTGLDFKNTITENDSINGIVFEYVYNGAGVAAGDVNNDGLEDLFFAGNQVSSKLFLNQGNLKFRDITEQSGTTTTRWCTGTSFVDVNADGLLDIYICVAGLGNPEARKNIFFINQGIDESGIPHFIDFAEKMGLADEGYSTMAAFFDYDKDQDMDVYILTNAMESKLRNALRPRKIHGEGPSTDRLYRNEGNGVFTDVSTEAGITQEGYGLGIGLGDLNQDGWLDIYCANDFLSNDLLWINNQDGTFSEESGKYFKHFTNNGMGMDIADYNNDGLLDVIVLDMLPMSNQRQKQMIGYRNLNRFYESMELGYHPQYLRNTLQLNRGKFEDGRYRFSEIGYLAGMHQTDWSWSPLLVDYDNDGWKDLSITNGYRKDVTNLDYIYFTLMQNSMFGTQEAREKIAINEMNDLEDVKLPNFIFKNERDLTFSDKSSEWGLDVPTFTNGTAFSDLDNDGDLDLVVNNIDQEAMIFRNLTSDRKKNHFLKIKFDSSVKSYEKIGLKVWIYQNDKKQFYEYNPYRGYKSTVGESIVVGLGKNSRIDTLRILWPGGNIQTYLNLEADSVLVIKNESSELTDFDPTVDLTEREYNLRFTDLTDSLNLKLRHMENSKMDLETVPIIMHNLGQYGPGIAVGDVNNDGLDDMFIGNDSDIPGTLLIQDDQNTFNRIPFPMDSIYEDLGSLFFDVDGDKDMDLYVVSGGSNWNSGDKRYEDRLYLNDGKGNFTRSNNILPSILSSGSCVTASDFDADGDLDLFVGGRITPDKFPTSPKSYILENRNGKLTDVTDQLLESRGFLGMVTSALWTDINLDNIPDLLLAGEYMPITVLINNISEFKDQTSSYGLENTNGWWNSINGADLDCDGDIDYILGNYGLNSFYNPTKTKPVEIYASDYDRNGTFDPITTFYIGDNSYILHPRNLMIDQIPSFENRFRTFEKYSTTPFSRSFTTEEIAGSVHLSCNMLSTIILEKTDNNRFEIHELPLEGQFSTTYGTLIEDFNQDGLMDVLLVGNSYAEETIFGLQDASFGSLLLNKGNFEWEFADNNSINLIADGDKKAITGIFTGDQKTIIITENNGYLQVLRPEPAPGKKIIKLEHNDWYILLEDNNGNIIKKEIYYGSGYLAQGSRKIAIGNNIKSIKSFNFSGETRKLD